MRNSSKHQSPLLTLKELAGLLKCGFRGQGQTPINGIANLENAQSGDLTFYADKKLRSLLERTEASAVIVSPDTVFDRLPVLISEDPFLSFIHAVSHFFSPYRPQPGIHPASHVSSSARIGKNVSIGAFSCIGRHAEIGGNAVLFPLVCVYPEVRIGRNTVIHSQVSLRAGVRIGNNVIIHSGAVIGSDGFGYHQTKEGQHIKIPQTGTVIIEDDVEIGANACIDRAVFDATVIRKGSKIDNLVQVAHNVEIGPDTILASQTGIAGSTHLGEKVITGGQVGIADHLSIGNRVIAAAKTGITKSLPDDAFVSGSPHLDIKEWRKAWASIPRLHDLLKEVRKLKKRVAELEKQK